MAKIDTPDIPSFFMNPSAYSQVKGEAKKSRGREIRRAGETDFSTVMDNLRGKTAEELGPLMDLPVSEETINRLMDDVRSTGDALKDRPFPEEILHYKQAVRNFMHYVVENSLEIQTATSFMKNKKKHYVNVGVIDKKLEDMAAMLISGQMSQLKLAASLEEIRGLLVDLLE
jgi:uncharacterized protein YaaR (DUF327 family)